jgi:hypothetical protein
MHRREALKADNIVAGQRKTRCDAQARNAKPDDGDLHGLSLGGFTGKRKGG